ncbi:MAG: lamin tail domain-containing protein [Chloroflexota bacterium]
MSFRRMLPFILINICVSTAVVLAILFWWDSRQAGVEPVVQNPTSPITANATPTSGPVANTESNQPQPTTAPESTEAPPLHIVQPGDTLGTISQLYDVPMEDIMEANGLFDANVISVGQQLLIPVEGLIEPTVEPTATEEAAIVPTPIDTQPPPESGEAIVEISQITAVSDVAAEAIQIRNVGTNSVALLNWKVADQDGFIYTFEQLTLFGDGAGIILHSRSGVDSVTEVFWGLETAVWSPGEIVTLLNADGSIVDTLTIPEE